MRLRSLGAAIAVAVAGLGVRSAAAQTGPPAAPPAPEKPAPPGDGWQNPAKAADPPLIPAPPAAPPDGTAVPDVPRPPPPPAPPILVIAAEDDTRLRVLEERMRADERRLRDLEDRLGFLRYLKLEAFIQPQLLVQSYDAKASPNVQPTGMLPPGVGANDIVAKADGTTTNGTFFRVRRARLRTFFETDAMRLFLQVDAFPAGGVGPGIGTILRNAEATAKVRWTRDIKTEITAGLFFTPFRRELLEISMTRPFIERTWFVQNCFPIERDYGVHAKTTALGERLVVDLAVVNGQRLGEREFVALPDLNRWKDFVGFVTYKAGFFTFGVNVYGGRGEIVDAASLRFKQFTRWGVNYHATAEHKFAPVGETRAIGEVTVGRNLDTGVNYAFAVPAIPTNIAADVTNIDQRALYLRLEQDVGRRLTFGYRFDTYTPNVDVVNDARDTHAFLIVGKISPNLRWMNELGLVTDNVHPAAAAAPSKHIVYFSSVLQAMF